jgi:hypothetical protein
MLKWRLTFEAYPETTVLGALYDPPIDRALFYVDNALDFLEQEDE